MRSGLTLRDELIALFVEEKHKEQAGELYDLLANSSAHQLILTNAFKVKPSPDELVFFLSCFVSLIERISPQNKEIILIQLVDHIEWLVSIYFLSQPLLASAQVIALINTFFSYPHHIEFSLQRIRLIKESLKEDFIEKLIDVINAYPTIKGISFLKIMDKESIISFNFLPNLFFDQNLGKTLKKWNRDLSEDEYLKLMTLIFTLSQELFESDAEEDDYFHFFHCSDPTVYQCVELVLEFPSLWQKLTELMVKLHASELDICLSTKLARLLIICLLPTLSEKIEAFQKLQNDEVITEADLKDLANCLSFLNEDFCHIPLSILCLYSHSHLEMALIPLKKIDPSSRYYAESLCLEFAIKTAIGEWEPCDDLSKDSFCKKETLAALKFILDREDDLFKEVFAHDQLRRQTAAIRALKSPFRSGLWFSPPQARAPAKKSTLADTNTTALATPTAFKIFG